MKDKKLKINDLKVSSFTTSAVKAKVRGGNACSPYSADCAFSEGDTCNCSENTECQSYCSGQYGCFYEWEPGMTN